MTLVLSGLLLRGWPGRDSSVATVVADAGDAAVDDRCVVNVVNDGDVYIRHRAIVKEMSIVPASTFKPVSEVAEPIVDAAVKANVRAPKTIVKNKGAVIPSPIGRSPQVTGFWRQHPGAWYPVVVAVVVAPRPVSWRPDITFVGARGLLVNRKRRRTEADRDAELSKRSRRHDQHYEREP